MSDDTKVKVVGLTKKFGDLLVLNDISFNVKKGDFVCIVGPTGCGKTTFLNLLVKLIEPTSGQILIDGEPADPKKHNIAFVFQEPSAYPWLTVEENLQYGLKIKKVDQKTIEERTKEIAESLGLTEVLKSYPRELSASLEQRVVIGRSFALHPDLLLMDEPYAQMDIKVRYYLEDQVIRYRWSCIYSSKDNKLPCLLLPADQSLSYSTRRGLWPDPGLLCKNQC